MAFEEIKDRDAWSTIRGFIYQVDTTILRWLQLKDNQVLELEKGEDIDIISGGLGSEDLARQLEQVKYREGTVTLNTPFVLEGMLNFFEHRKNNPTQHLVFRFVTNSSPGNERPSLFASGEKAIEVWKDLQNDSTVAEKDNRLLIIRDHLIKKIDETLNEADDSSLSGEQQLAKEFKSNISEDRNFLLFLKDFEWSTKNPGEPEITETIKKTCVDFNIVSDASKAGYFHTRLFYFVFRLLATSGRKVLDKKSLAEQAALPELGDTDRKMFLTIESLLKSVEERVRRLETDFAITRAQVVTLVDDINIIKTTDSAFEYGLSRLILTPPFPVQGGASRKRKVDELLKALDNYKWIHLCGINGTGKTQLAVLLCQRFQDKVWIDLRPYSSHQELARLYVQACIEKFFKTSFTFELQNWLENAFQNLSTQVLIVVNDLPRLEEGYRLNELLLSILQSAGDVKIISTSNYSIPAHVQQHIQAASLLEYSDLNFDQGEVKEFLINNAAPDEVVDRSDLITDISAGNTRIVASIVQHLKSIRWSASGGKFIEAIFQREFTKEFLGDVENSIRKYIVNTASRELLYRLSFLHWPFPSTMVQAIAGLTQAIPHPREKLLDLLNVWIQQTNDEYLLSPLVYDVGKDNLDGGLVEKIHRTIGETIAKEKGLNQITAARCITAFINGKDYNNAGLIYLTALQAAKTDNEIHLLSEWLYPQYWKGTDLPGKMSVVIRASIRHEQIRILGHLGQDTTRHSDWLQQYGEEKEISTSQRVWVTMLILLNWKSDALEKYWRYLNFILDENPGLEKSFQTAFSPQAIETFIWLPVLQITRKEDLKQWLSAILRLNKLTSGNIFEQNEFERAAHIISRKIFESGKKNPADWPVVEESLNLFNTYFGKEVNDKLEALVRMFLIKSNYEQSKDLSQAEKETLQISASLSSSEARYYLYDNLGKLYYDHDKKKSIHWLNKAIDAGYRPKTYFLETLVYAASAAATESIEKQLAHLKEALAIVRSSDEFDELQETQLLGELAIGYWRAGRHLDAFQHFEELVIKLLAAKSSAPTRQWIDNFMLTGHTLGYIAASVSGSPIPKSSDGEDYFEPHAGLFVFNNRNLSDLYIEKNLPVIRVQLALLADAVNLKEKSYEWSLKAFDAARQNYDQNIFLMITGICAQFSLINFKLEETLESYLLFAAVNNSASGDAKTRYDAMAAVNLTELINSKPSAVWNAAEDNVISFAITPLVIMVMTNHIEGKSHAKEDQAAFLKLLNEYLPGASDQSAWRTLTNLCVNIFDKNVSIEELRVVGNDFGKKGRKNFQSICNVGVLYLTKDNDLKLFQLVNEVPYLILLHKQCPSILKFVINPFVKHISVKVLKEGFVGSKGELEKLLNVINSVDVRQADAPQLILQPLVKEFGVALNDDRKRWLYDV